MALHLTEVKAAGPQRNECEQLTVMWMAKMDQTVNEFKVQAIEKDRNQNDSRPVITGPG
tara:strand:- start:1315 stop:1491 length:177 start_codon:yes stop_codon:yes gene_type:complete